VLYLRAFASPASADSAVRELAAIAEVRHVMRSSTADATEVMITADVGAVAVDDALDALQSLGLAAGDISVERANLVGPVDRRRGQWITGRHDALIWAEVVEGAREHARLPARYLVFMAVAGVLAGLAVILGNSVLLVGAMAVSPDLLPVTAACVAIIGRRPRLLVRSVGTLALGLTMAICTAWLVTELLAAIGYLWSKALPQGTGLTLPPSVQAPTIIIAFVAGIAGMLATETRASAAVGVAISVTTIPAAAYTGVAIAIGKSGEALGGLDVLAANILMLLVGGTLALAVQRGLRRRAERRLHRRSAPEAAGGTR
jgi:uncharacterized hydrophobic protein (TIGR00271 family)